MKGVEGQGAWGPIRWRDARKDGRKDNGGTVIQRFGRKDYGGTVPYGRTDIWGEVWIFFTTVQQDIEAFGEPLLSEGISYRDFCPRLRNDFWEA